MPLDKDSSASSASASEPQDVVLRLAPSRWAPSTRAASPRLAPVFRLALLLVGYYDIYCYRATASCHPDLGIYYTHIALLHLASSQFLWMFA
jgi:hypothetical protein